ncbi:unnamed protein product [Echinostoma caproni]|uniref:PKD_channel domain-containing protein n=1 Tax=Echinostoma caproni TaxID=27848 RepID=A0A183AUV1_9TREM|nr:unnamed protein product [Echinostoma caproni]
MAQAYWLLSRILIWTVTCFVLIRADAVDQREKIYDAETGQYFPISELSKRVDPQFVLPDPDPVEFPPEYLAELLTHCDDPIPGAWEFLQKTWIAFREFGLNWSRYPVSKAVLSRILMAVRPIQLLHAFIVAVVLSVARYMLQYCLLEYAKQRLGITTRNAQRFFESSWKAFWYLIMWLCTFHALILKGRTDFQLHRIGALVVLLHDLNDVFLELAKVNVYLRMRKYTYRMFNVALSNLFFVLFATSW